MMIEKPRKLKWLLISIIVLLIVVSLAMPLPVGVSVTSAETIPRTATLVVAASNALITQADYVCDGIADNVEIQTAIDSVSVVGGGKVLLSEGTFNISAPIIPKQYVHLQGQGGGFPETRTGTWLKLANGINTDVIQYLHQGGGSTYYDFYGIISDLAIDGNKANNTSGNGINFDQCRRARIENVFIGWCADDGLHLGTATTISSWMVINNCTLWQNAQRGVYAHVVGCVFSNTNSDENGASGFRFSGDLIDCNFLYSGNNGAGTPVDAYDRGGFLYLTGNESAWVRCFSEGNVGNAFLFKGLHAVNFHALMDKNCQLSVPYHGASVQFDSNNTNCYVDGLYIGNNYANKIGVWMTGGGNENIQIDGGTINMYGIGQTGITLEGTPNHRIQGVRIIADIPLSGALGTGTIVKDNIGITGGVVAIPLVNASFEEGNPPTGWTPTQPTATSRSAEQVKVGIYSVKLASTWAEERQSISNYADYKGKMVTAGIWAYTSLPTCTYIALYDGVEYANSSYHTGVVGWQWLTVTRTVSASATELTIHADIQNHNLAYFDGAKLVEGTVCVPD